jgi:hypothetical protein
MTYLFNFMPMYRRMQVPVPEHSKSQKRQCDGLREEDSSYIGRDVCKCISNTPNSNILKPCCMLYERISVCTVEDIPIVDKTQRQFYNCTKRQGLP